MGFFGLFEEKKRDKTWVLHVDDSTLVLRAALPILSKELGFHVITAQSGEEALVKAKAERPDIILLDLTLPVMDGYAVLQGLKGEEKTKDIPVLMCTASDNMSDVEKAFNLGACGYLTKPLNNKDRIRKKVSEALAKKATPA